MGPSLPASASGSSEEINSLVNSAASRNLLMCVIVWCAFTANLKSGGVAATHPASNFGVTGIYCFDADVFGVIPTLTPSGRGELEITDVNNYYIDQGRMKYDVLEGFWGDAGESIEAYYAVNDFVRANGANGA